jgi:hypothetical protein
MARSFIITFITVLSVAQLATAFTQPALVSNKSKLSPTAVSVFGGKKKKDKSDFDLSSIESRDVTREEMLDINKQNNEIMNMELQMMTIFSLVLSAPILYLCWVAFYSD